MDYIIILMAYYDLRGYIIQNTLTIIIDVHAQVYVFLLIIIIRVYTGMIFVFMYTLLTYFLSTNQNVKNRILKTSILSAQTVLLTQRV